MIFRKKNKIFCIGFNKTGTTSLEKALIDLGFKMGYQRAGELLFDDWIKRDFTNIIKLAKTADAFQDIPFSLPFTYIALDQYFKNAKFILTVRNDSQEWYESLVRFHAKLWGDGSKKKLDADDLKNASYIYKGRPYHTNKHIFYTNDSDVYNPELLQKAYDNHNESVTKYFASRPDDLLVLNLAEEGAYKKMCAFLKIKPIDVKFPVLNTSK